MATRPSAKPDDGRRDAPVRTRRPPQRHLTRRPPARDGLAPEGQHQQDQHQGHQFAGPGRERRMHAVEVHRQRLERPDAEARRDGPAERVEAPHHCGSQRRHDEQRVGPGHQRDQGRDQHAGDAADDEADDPVEQRDAVGREPADQRAHLGLRRRPRGQSETRVTEQHCQHDTQNDDRPGQPEPVGRDVRPEEADVVLGEDRVDVDDRRPGLVLHHCGQQTHEADGRHRLRHRPVVAQRPEDQQVAERAQHGLDGQRRQQRRPEAPGRADADRGREPGDGVEQLPVAQERVGVGGIERLGPGSEVQDTRRAVGDDQCDGQGGEDAAVAQAQEQELDVGAQRPSTPCMSRIFRRPPGTPHSQCTHLVYLNRYATARADSQKSQVTPSLGMGQAPVTRFHRRPTTATPEALKGSPRRPAGPDPGVQGFDVTQLRIPEMHRESSVDHHTRRCRLVTPRTAASGCRS